MSTPQQYLAQAHAAWWRPWSGNLNEDLNGMAVAMKLAREAFAMLAATKTFQPESESQKPEAI